MIFHNTTSICDSLDQIIQAEAFDGRFATHAPTDDPSLCRAPRVTTVPLPGSLIALQNIEAKELPVDILGDEPALMRRMESVVGEGTCLHLDHCGTLINAS